MTTEEIVSKYSGSENVKQSIKLQHMIEDYVLLLQTKIRNGEISAGMGRIFRLACKNTNTFHGFKWNTFRCLCWWSF